jgi:hypothetical protein
MPYETIRQLATEYTLTVKEQEDGKLVIHGQPENIKAYVKKMASMQPK